MNAKLVVLVFCQLSLTTFTEGGDVYPWILDYPKTDSALMSINENNGGLRMMLTTYRNLTFTRYRTQCVRQCKLDPNCMSVNFHALDFLCEINTGDHITNAQHLGAEQAGWVYYSSAWFQINKEALGKCGDRECTDGKRCLEVCERDGWTKDQCVCIADKESKINCKERDTAIWTDWSEWSDCTTTCGLGLRRRRRQCTHPHVEGMLITPDNCPGLEEDINYCDMGQCPSWKKWSDWTACSASFSCGSGTKSRNRTCHNGMVNVDERCMGSEREDELCYAQSCDNPIRLVGGLKFGEGRIEIYDDQEQRWGGVCADNWDNNAAQVACKQALLLENVREATKGSVFGELTTPLMLKNLQCSGSEASIQECNHDGWNPKKSDCAKGAAGVKCIVDGQWSEWGEWGACSVTCDWGFKERLRSCTHPPPTYGGKDCDEGQPKQRRKCYPVICPIAGVWAAWSDWSGCSLTCGSGLRYRNRTCIGPFYNGDPCPIIPEGTVGREPCSTQRCPFHNCHEYKVVDKSENNGMFLIDPDGPGDLAAFEVECDMMTDEKFGITVLHHDSEEKGHVSGFESRGEYSKYITYSNANLSQAISLVEASVDCEMFVSWECMSANIHEPESTYIDNVTTTLTYISGRNFEELDYFPGGVPGTYACACWEDKTCAKPEYWCNCDANIEEEAKIDSGLVSVKKDLPLTGFHAGDTGAPYEEGWHTMGPLKCKGSKSEVVAGQTHPMYTLKPTDPVYFGDEAPYFG